MKITFAREILQFVESINMVDKYIFLETKKVIDKYAQSKFDIDKVKIMKIYINGERTILKKFTLKDFADDTIGDEIVFDGQMPFIINQPSPKTAWITSSVKGEFLIDAESYIDHYLRLKNIPKFIRGDSQSLIRTSIIVPYFEKRKNKQFIQGVVNYESNSYLEYTKEERREIEELTQAIAKLMYLYDVYVKQSYNTDKALKKIDEKFELYKSMPKVKNNIFLAYPKNSESDVVDLIKEVIESDFKEISYFDWCENSKTGTITKEIFEQIETSKYGICYLSQKDGKGRYKDNINVMFEAGLMHSKSQYLNMWIPIREVASPPKAFDTSGLNHIEIERENGEFDQEAFKKKLRSMLKTMIEKE